MYLNLLVLPTSEGNFVTCSWCSNRVPENRAERLFGNALKQVHFRGEECIPSHATAVQFATQHSFSFSFKSSNVAENEKTKTRRSVFACLEIPGEKSRSLTGEHGLVSATGKAREQVYIRACEGERR